MKKRDGTNRFDFVFVWDGRYRRYWTQAPGLGFFLNTSHVLPISPGLLKKWMVWEVGMFVVPPRRGRHFPTKLGNQSSPGIEVAIYWFQPLCTTKRTLQITATIPGRPKKGSGHRGLEHWIPTKTVRLHSGDLVCCWSYMGVHLFPQKTVVSTVPLDPF